MQEKERFRIRGCEIDTRGFLRETRREKSFWKCENADCGCTESCPSYFSFFLTFISICERRETLQRKRKNLLVTIRRSKFAILEIIIRSELFLENNRKTLASQVFVYGRVCSRIVCLWIRRYRTERSWIWVRWARRLSACGRWRKNFRENLETIVKVQSQSFTDSGPCLRVLYFQLHPIRCCYSGSRWTA